MAKSSVLLVEGIDDFHVVSGLLKHHRFPECFSIHEKGGIDNLLKVIPVQIKASDVQAVGIVVDADLQLADRWQSVRSILATAGYDGLPNEPVTDGLVASAENRPKIGVWLMPDNVVPGMLEDFVSYLVPMGDELLPRVRAVIDGLPPHEIRFPLAHRTKAEIHTWLAWQAEPGTPMGLSIAKRYLDPTAPNVSIFLNWLERLFIH